MKAHIDLTMLFILAAAGSAANLWAEEGVLDATCNQEELRKLRQEINILNLVNGLKLSPSQVEELLRFAREAEKVRKETAATADPLIMAARESFAKLQQAVENNGGIPKEVEARAARLERELKESHDTMDREIRTIEERMLARMNDGQRDVIANYKDCLIPTLDLKDPARVGQASSQGHSIKLLRDLRQIPEDVYAIRGEEIFSGLMSRIEEHKGPRTPKERETFRTNFFKTADTARTLSAVEFEMQKEKLAAAIEPEDKFAQTRMRVEEMREKAGKPGKAARILLATEAIGIYEKRLELMANELTARSTNLASIQAADTCKDGQCALPGRGNLAKEKPSSKKEDSR